MPKATKYHTAEEEGLAMLKEKLSVAQLAIRLSDAGLSEGQLLQLFISLEVGSQETVSLLSLTPGLRRLALSAQQELQDPTTSDTATSRTSALQGPPGDAPLLPQEPVSTCAASRLPQNHRVPLPKRGVAQRNEMPTQLPQLMSTKDLPDEDSSGGVQDHTRCRGTSHVLTGKEQTPYGIASKAVITSGALQAEENAVCLTHPAKGQQSDDSASGPSFHTAAMATPSATAAAAAKGEDNETYSGQLRAMPGEPQGGRRVPETTGNEPLQSAAYSLNTAGAHIVDLEQEPQAYSELSELAGPAEQPVAQLTLGLGGRKALLAEACCVLDMDGDRHISKMEMEQLAIALADMGHSLEAFMPLASWQLDAGEEMTFHELMRRLLEASSDIPDGTFRANAGAVKEAAWFCRGVLQGAGQPVADILPSAASPVLSTAISVGPTLSLRELHNVSGSAFTGDNAFALRKAARQEKARKVKATSDLKRQKSEIVQRILQSSEQ